MAHTYLLALDAGGGGGHAVVVDVEARTVTRAFRSWRHAVAAGTGGLGFDVDLEAAWRLLAEAATEAIARAGAAPGDVAGIAATSMRHTTVVLDAAGAPLLATPNRDGRAIAETFTLLEREPEAHYARTGHWPSPLTTAARLGWLAANRKADLGRATTVFSLGDWLAYRLSGERATDPSQASETLLLDVATRTWSADAAAALDVPLHLLAPLADAGTRLGTLRGEAAAALGLAAGIPVAVGGADTQCGLLGSGVLRPGEVGIIAGTTVPVQMVRAEPTRDPARRLWTCCHVLPDAWVLESNGGPMGEMLSWLASVLCPDAPSPVARMLAEAELAEPGAGGLLSSLGGQVMNARAMELPVGSLTLTHMTTADDPDRRAHVARAYVDGMAYAVRANLDQIREVSGADAARVVFGGGMARSGVVTTTLADALGLPVTRSSAIDATALGAAICAGVGAGVFASLTEGTERLLGSEADLFTPDTERAALHESGYAGWRRLREARAPADAIARELLLPGLLASFERAAARTPAAPAERPRILVTAQMDEGSLARLRALGDVEYASFRDAKRLLAGDQLVEALAGVAVFVTEVDVVDAAVLERLPDLRVVVACRADAVNVDAEACAAYGIPVLNAPGRNADAVADLAVAFMLMLARRLPDATGFLRQPGIEAGDMGRMGQAFTQLQGRELWRKTVGLVGFGAVGTKVARRLAGFGARVLAYDPYASPERLARGGAEAADLAMLLATSDVVSLHAAVTDETRGMIDATALAAMKPGAYLVNTARAALVDEDALGAALRSGRLAGAALDVFAVEPPGSDHPLLAIDTVVATPHVAGNTAEIGAHQGEIVAADLARMVRGERPLHPVVPRALDGFDWHAPRPAPDRAALARLAGRPAPAVTDLQRDRAPKQAAATPAAATAGADAIAGMTRLLEAFLGAAREDAGLTTFAAGKDVLLGFTLPDVALHFFLGLHDGHVAADLGDPSAEPDVQLRMRAAVFDGIFTGTVNAMEAATSGGLSFTGDTLKAMTLQEIQDDLTRLYLAAREQVGPPGDLGPVAAARPAHDGHPPAAVAAGDPRVEVVHVIEELYAAGLITATGGNVSVRVPGTDEIWITPGQVFKGTLTPEMLVRIDLDGQPLDEGAASPSSERLMHCAVYRARPDAHAVIHAHAPNATVLADAEIPFLPISTEAAFFGDLPRVPFIMPGSQELANAVGAAMATSWAVLMTNHGLLVAGRSLRRAADMAEVIERSAEVILGCHAVGRTPSVLPDAVVARLRKMGDMMA